MCWPKVGRIITNKLNNLGFGIRYQARIEKKPWFGGKKTLLVSIFVLNFPIKMLFQEYVGEKSPNVFPADRFYLALLTKVYRKPLMHKIFPEPEKILWLHAWKRFFCLMITQYLQPGIFSIKLKYFSKKS